MALVGRTGCPIGLEEGKKKNQIFSKQKGWFPADDGGAISSFAPSGALRDAGAVPILATVAADKIGTV